jgi:hypothetical protein
MASYLGHPFVRENSDAILILTTVMTVFAGFLVAIMTILGDPVMIPKGSWRIAENRHHELEDSIIRHMYLFYLYLISIGLMFAGVLMQKHHSYSKVLELLMECIEFAYLFFGVWAFLLTLALPKALGKIQLERSEAEIAARREIEGIREPPPSS